MTKGATYYGLLAALRQSELLEEAERRHRYVERRPRRRGRLLGLIFPRLRGSR